MSIITLTTDFGQDSAYVAQMKGIVLGRSPQTKLVDITHSVGAQNVREAAWILGDVVDAFPADTIHVVVVDPGVGSARNVVCVEFSFGICVAPDNGVLTRLANREQPTRIVRLSNPAYWRAKPSQTFHGRDIMAPVAAAIANGVKTSLLGGEVSEIQLLGWPQSASDGDNVSGIVMYVDSFGNLITNISRRDLGACRDPAKCTIQVGIHTICGVRTHYAAVEEGTLIALLGSGDQLEIAVVNGDARQRLGERGWNRNSCKLVISAKWAPVLRRGWTRVPKTVQSNGH